MLEALAFILMSVQIKFDKVIELNTDNECLSAFNLMSVQIKSVYDMFGQATSDKVVA